MKPKFRKKKSINGGPEVRFPPIKVFYFLSRPLPNRPRGALVRLCFINSPIEQCVTPVGFCYWLQVCLLRRFDLFRKKFNFYLTSFSHLWHSFRAHEDYADGNCCEREGCGDHQNRKNHQAFSVSWKALSECDKYRIRSLFFYCKFLSSTTVNYRL